MWAQALQVLLILTMSMWRSWARGHFKRLWRRLKDKYGDWHWRPICFKVQNWTNQNSVLLTCAPSLSFVYNFEPIRSQYCWPARARSCFFCILGYCERLITGQLDFKWNGEDRNSKRHSMKSNLSMTSDSTPESESCRTSLADISHGGGSRASRRRSGSRTSRGSRGKTLRLTIEHKLGISKKEQF